MADLEPGLREPTLVFLPRPLSAVILFKIKISYFDRILNLLAVILFL